MSDASLVGMFNLSRARVSRMELGELGKGVPSNRPDAMAHGTMQLCSHTWRCCGGFAKLGVGVYRPAITHCQAAGALKEMLPANS